MFQILIWQVVLNLGHQLLRELRVGGLPALLLQLSATGASTTERRGGGKTHKEWTQTLSCGKDMTKAQETDRNKQDKENNKDYGKTKKQNTRKTKNRGGGMCALERERKPKIRWPKWLRSDVNTWQRKKPGRDIGGRIWHWPRQHVAFSDSKFHRQSACVTMTWPSTAFCAKIWTLQTVQPISVKQPRPLVHRVKNTHRGEMTACVLRKGFHL